MKAVSIWPDGRIHARNVLFDFTIGEYLDAIRSALNRNRYQRKRVASSKSIYSLLKADILKGCVIPPIVLALTQLDGDADIRDYGTAEAVVNANFDKLIILDGLQRTWTLSDLEAELPPEERRVFREKQLRVEIYIGLNKIGILYRMLTLNTGQTPMSIRHQIEMLYLDYLDAGVEGIRFLREIDGARATDINELNFREVIEGFNSYLERDELPMDRSDLLENIKSLETLSTENSSLDIFKEFVLGWVAFNRKVHDLCGDKQLAPSDEYETRWGRNALQMFRKAQVMAGFGAALGKLKDFGKIADLGAVPDTVAMVQLNTEVDDFLISFNKAMGWITDNTKKIGNAQRMYFQFYFRELFNPDTDSYLSLDKSVVGALQKLRSQIF